MTMLTDFHWNVCMSDAVSPGFNWTCCLGPPGSAQHTTTGEPIKCKGPGIIWQEGLSL